MRTMQIVAWLALLLVAVQCAPTLKWRACDNSQDLWTPLSVELTPDPAISGKVISFTVKGAADRTVQGGHFIASVKFIGIPVAQETQNICLSTHCPIVPGPIDVTWSEKLPSFTPPGPYEVQLQLKDGSDSLLMCLIVDFRINWWGKVEGEEEATIKVVDTTLETQRST